MSDVVFAFGNRPVLDSGDAEELAQALIDSTGRQLSREQERLACRIQQAARQPAGTGPTELTPDRTELEALATFFEAIQMNAALPSWRALYDELRRHRGAS